MLLKALLGPALAAAMFVTHAAAHDTSAAPHRSTRIPYPLTQLESAAEDMGDAAAAGDWGKAEALATKARGDLDALGKAFGSSTSTSRQHLEDARKAIASRRSLDAQRAANALSADVVELYAGYNPVVPVEVMRLDVVLRQAQIDGVAGSPRQAAPALRQAQGIWSKLRDQAPLAATDTARRFDQELATVERAASSANASAFKKSSGAALEGVDALERVFERAGHRK